MWKKVVLMKMKGIETCIAWAALAFYMAYEGVDVKKRKEFAKKIIHI